MVKCLNELTFGTNGEPDCTAAQMVVGLDLPCETRRFLWTWEAYSNDRAYLLARELQGQLDAAIKRAHRLAYEQGYRDGRGKKRKKTGFALGFRPGTVAW